MQADNPVSPFKQLVEKAKPFVKKLSGKDADKAITDLARNLASALSEAGVDFDKYVGDYNKDVIFNPSCLLANNDNIFSFVADNYKELAKIMFSQRPVGLGTPNAMVGECEFMALFFSPRVGIAKQKDKGDLTVDGKFVELKGTQLRFFSPKKITGRAVQAHAKIVSAKYGVTPNQTRPEKGDKDKKIRSAFEPWDNGKSKSLSKTDHWIAEFKKLGMDQSCKYLDELCNVFMDCDSSEYERCFDKDGKFNSTKLQLLIVECFFSGMEKKWDVFTQINEDKITCISDDKVAFAKLIKNNKIVMDGNYFRSFQDMVVGLYVKLN